MIKNINEIIKNSHLILYGKSGIGKTNFIKNNVKQIHKYLYINNKINMSWVKNNLIKILKRNNKNEYKVIVFDNCDILNFYVQLILRVILEKYSNNNRFIFICNNINSIISPIKSRCMVYDFQKNNCISHECKYVNYNVELILNTKINDINSNYIIIEDLIVSFIEYYERYKDNVINYTDLLYNLFNLINHKYYIPFIILKLKSLHKKHFKIN